jgi:hypothetical protein
MPYADTVAPAPSLEELKLREQMEQIEMYAMSNKGATLTAVAVLVMFAFAINYFVGIHQKEAEFTRTPHFNDATIIAGEFKGVEFVSAQSFAGADLSIIEVSGRKFRVQGVPGFMVGEELRVAYRNADSKVFSTLSGVMDAHKDDDLRTVAWLCGRGGCNPIFRR